MPTAKLTKFNQEIRASWGIFRRTWRTSFKIVFLPLLPLLFTIPYLIELSASLQYNEIPTLKGATVVSFLLAVIGLIAFFMLLEIVRIALFVVFTDNKIGARKALQLGTKRFPVFLYTDIVSFVYLVFASIPLFVLIFWTNNGGKELMHTIFNPIIGDIMLVIAFVIFAIPLFVIAIWLSFTQVIVAVGKYTGFHALTYSTTLVRPIFKQITKRLIAWLIIYVVISQIVSPLPIAYWLIPLILKLVGVALLVVLYEEASGTINKNTPAAAVVARIKRTIRREKEVI